jgi:hypothetical protein
VAQGVRLEFKPQYWKGRKGTKEGRKGTRKGGRKEGKKKNSYTSYLKTTKPIKG